MTGHSDQPPVQGSAASGLRVMQAHLAADCPDRATCWAKDIHDAHNPAVNEGAPMEIETQNDFLVGVQGDKINVLLAGISMDKPAALRMAAWLVALADEGDDFPAVLAAVQST